MWQKTRIAMALLLAGASIQPVLALEPSVATVTRKLLWSQEFNGKANTAPDPKAFTYDLGDGGGWGNSEQQYYTKQRQNVRIDGKGNLVISAVRIPDPLYFDPCITCSFTSARLKTQDRIGFRYGRIEARIKIPAGVGTWPAFWMLGADLGKTTTWPDSGEIDIMEAKGSQSNWAYGTVHGPGYSGGQAIGGLYISPKVLSEDFHVYRIDWRPNLIEFFVDGNPYFSMDPSLLGDRKWVFNKEYFLILNIAMGGNFTGEIDPAVQRADMYIDYIRHYSLNGVGKVIKRS